MFSFSVHGGNAVKEHFDDTRKPLTKRAGYFPAIFSSERKKYPVHVL